MDDELKVLLGETYTTGSGEIITLGKVPFGKLHIFSSAVASLLEKVDKLRFSVLGLSNDKNDKQIVALLLESAFEEMVQIMGLLLNKPREWFDSLDPSDGIEIAYKLYLKNLDDRAKKNLAALLKTAISQLQTLSKASSQQATPGMTSEDTTLTRSGLSPEASSS